MSAVLVTAATVTQDSPFYPGGRPQAESTCVLDSVRRWFTRPKTVIHPGTDRPSV